MISEKEKIKIGFIGSGFAQSVQAPLFSKIDDVELFGAASPHSAEEFAEKFKMPFFSNDWKKLIEHPEIDLICVVSPPVFHFEQTLFALENNKNVLCEKPFTLNLEQAKELKNKALNKNLLALVDHELRFSPQRLYMKHLIDSGEIGEIFFIRAHHNADYWLKGKYKWWSDKSYGGGAWGAIGSHLIDQLRFFGGEIKTAFPVLQTSIKTRLDKEGNERNVTSDDYASCQVEFYAGFKGIIEVSVVSHYNRFDIEVSGSKGCIKIDMDDQLYLSLNKAGYKRIDVPLTEQNILNIQRFEEADINASGPFARAFIHYADAIIEALKTGTTSLKGAVDFDDGVKIQEVLDKGWYG